MKPIAMMFAVLALIAFAALAWLTKVAGGPPIWIFTGSSSLPKLVDLMLAATLAAVIVIGLVRLARRAKDVSGLMTLATWWPPAVGALVAAQQGFIIYIATQMAHTAHLRILAPSLCQALLPLTLGLGVGAIAAFLNGFRTSPPHAPS
jgi:hypothetical protein